MSYSRRQLVDVFLTKLKFNLKSEASKTYLGYVWWVLEPALFVLVLYLVFGIFRARGTPDFVIFLVIGKIPFLWFSKSVVNASNSILQARGLINQVIISKAFFPLLVVAQDVVKQLFVLTLMFVFLIWFGLEPNLAWLYFPLLFVVQLLLIVACSLITAMITPFLPDFKYILSTGMVLLMLMSGIFFDYREVVLPKHQSLFLANPMARLLTEYRRILMDGQPPEWLSISIIALISFLVIIALLRFYRRIDTPLARRVL